MIGRKVEFRVLGPLEVRIDGVQIPVGGPKQRALLALLLLSANRVVSRDRLVTELFAGEGEETATRRLNVQISRLRAALTSNGDEPRVITRSPGYILRVEPGELDLETFERLVEQGRTSLEQRNPRDASAQFRAAEALWRGQLLADLVFEPFAPSDVARLAELRTAAIEERIEAELALGRGAVLVAELDALVAASPLRERLRGQLMLALYRAGRQADALAVYRAGREVLVDELALEPSAPLRHLQQAILLQDASLDARRAPDQEAQYAPTVERHARRAAGLAALSLAVAAGVVAAAFTFTTRGSAGRVPPPTGNALVLVSPRSGALDAALPLRSAPGAVVSGFHSLWVSEADAGIVARVDPGRRAVTATIQVGRGPDAIAVGAGDVWVVKTLDDTVARIDPSTDTETQTIPVGDDPSDVVVSAGSVWVANRGDDDVIRINPRTGGIVGVVKTDGGPSALAATGAIIWVANDEAGTIQQIDGRTGALVDTIRVGDAPSALAAMGGNIWVLDRLDSTLSRVDETSGVVKQTVALSGSPAALAVSDDAVWVANDAAGTLSRFDPRTGDVMEASTVGARPQALVARGGIWAGVAAGGAAHRGGTLRVVNSAPEIDSTDPLVAMGGPPPELLGMTNDGLVTLNHVAGAEGTRLVPDLALSLPIPTDGGRTYAFRLRSGIRYSTGALVEPSDVRRSFERLFEYGSDGASMYGAIAGASACSARLQTCDLARGIVTDDRARTVVFHLRDADPNFLYKLALTYAYIVPASAPSHVMQTLPATGPYMIEHYRAGDELDLVRNPHFHEWSASAQPDGYPDRIVIRNSPSDEVGVERMARGDGDFMGGATPRGETENLLLHDPGHVRINPVMFTGFLALNVNAPPFNDIRVRKALNLALDRGSIAVADGGSIAARPTCQVLPPRLPGYQRYCPYTRNPTARGDWHGPDLALARRLVRRSGTRGMRVTVWDTPETFAVTEGRAAVSALQKLGYRASLHRLPDDKYSAYVDDSRNRAQVIDVGWNADYASASSLLNRLACAAFVPGEARATMDDGEFCDRKIDKRIAHAAAVQTLDRSSANQLWASLDRDLTDRAIWLPTVTVNEIDLISHRVGNYRYNPVWGPLVDLLWVR